MEKKILIVQKKIVIQNQIKIIKSLIIILFINNIVDLFFSKIFKKFYLFDKYLVMHS